jgi:hypothetical protein
MPVDTRSRTHSPTEPALDLPPPFRLVTLREVGDAFAHAKTIAADAGAGTLVYVGRFDLAEFAVVLEPEEPLAIARRAFYIGCAALGDALTVHAPPEKLVEFDWPGTIRVDHGTVGGARLAWPDGAEENAVPDWLVFSAMIRTVSMGEEEPGMRPLAAALEEEGFDDATSGQLVESFARHLMVALDTWQEAGFGEIAKSYLARLSPEQGVRRDIDDNGDLVVRPVSAGLGKADVERRKLVPALAMPAWLDPDTGGPRR